MKNIVFQIVKMVDIPFNLSLSEMRKYPVQEHYLKESQEIIVLYSYDPRNMTQAQETKYIDLIMQKLKRKYKAYSITVGELQQQLPNG